MDQKVSLRFPAFVSLFTTRQVGGRIGDVVKSTATKQYSLSSHSFVPSREWLANYMEGPLPPVRRLPEYGANASWVGVTSVGADVFRIENGLLDPDSLRRRLKRSVLLFDKLAVYDIVPTLSLIPDKDLVNEIHWLLESEIICQPEVEDREYPQLSDEYEAMQMTSAKEMVDIMEALGLFYQAAANDKERRLNDVAKAVDKDSWWQIRCAALFYREIEDFHLIPVLPKCSFESLRRSELESQPDTGEAVRIILHAMPQPSDQSSWQDIVQYKNDPQVRRDLLNIRNWANQVARQSLKANEISDMLEGLIENYKAHIRPHKMALQVARAEWILTVDPGVIQDLLHFRPADALKRVFEFRKAKIELMKEELKVPGSEVAYIFRTSEDFTD